RLRDGLDERRLRRRNDERGRGDFSGRALLGVAKIFVEDQERRRELLVQLRRRAHVLETIFGELAMASGAIPRFDRAAVDAFALRRFDAEGLAREIEVEFELAIVRRAEEVEHLAQIAVR